MDARLHADLGRAELERVVDPAHEVGLRVLVGVGRALADPEAAERAADGADVGDVDVAVDDERHEVAGQLGAQLVGGLAHVLDHLGAALGEHRLELLGRSASGPSRARSIVSGLRRPGCVAARHEATRSWSWITSSTRGAIHSSFMYCG